MDKKLLNLALILFSVLLLASCSSLAYDASGVEKATGYTERDAILFLGADMLDEVEFVMDPALLEGALEPSYVHYSEFVPLYEEYKKGYLSQLASIAAGMIPEFFSDLDMAILSLSANTDRYILEDISLASDLYDYSHQDMTNALKERLGASDEVKEAFAISQREFNAIKAVYENLANIGLSYNMPAAEMANLEFVAAAVVDSFFDTLGVVEIALKNRVHDDSSPYSYFWEGRNE